MITKMPIQSWPSGVILDTPPFPMPLCLEGDHAKTVGTVTGWEAGASGCFVTVEVDDRYQGFPGLGLSIGGVKKGGRFQVLEFSLVVHPDTRTRR